MRRVTILTKNGNSNTVAVPRDLLAALKWQPREALALFVIGDVLVVKSTQAAIDQAGRACAKVAQQLDVELATQ